MLFWSTASQLTSKLERLRSAESRLLALARRFDPEGEKSVESPQITMVDTWIPRSVILPVSSCVQEHNTRRTSIQSENHDFGKDNCLLIHSIHVSASSNCCVRSHDTPLVLLHGYMNASMWFYRNLMGLGRFFRSIHAVDLLGWGLSSRPELDWARGSVAMPNEVELKRAHDFFVESLEAWRQAQKIDRMVLAGHSMGGYLSVAYCERYPQHVDHLILISPVGVPEESASVREQREVRLQSSWRSRFTFTAYTHLFHNYTVGDILRTLPVNWGRKKVMDYVQRRVSVVTDPEEQQACADYLYYNNTLPGSAEYSVSRILTPTIFAHSPLEHRIPQLGIGRITFLYGAKDWMDASGGLKVQSHCEERRKQGQSSPQVDVYEVSNAGHLVMVDNWQEFNAGVIMAVTGTTQLGHDLEQDQVVHLPTKLCPKLADQLAAQHSKRLPAFIRQARDADPDFEVAA